MAEDGSKDVKEVSETGTKKSNSSETDNSLSLSITPPILEDDGKKGSSDGSISEHLSSNNTLSIENDRSFQEIEISSRPSDTLLNLSGDNGQNITQEQPCLIDTDDDKSKISLNFLEKQNILNVEPGTNVRSILEEILGNEQFHSNRKNSNSTSKEESLNIFENLNLDDQSLTNYKLKDEEQNLYANSFDFTLKSEGDVDRRLRDYEELLAIKDNTIAALTSELDYVRELSNPNTGSTLSTTEYKQLQEECHTKLLEYNSVIIYKNDLIQKLSESLDQSVTDRQELLLQIDRFKYEVAQLQEQLQETTKMVAEHKCNVSKHEEGDLEELNQGDQEDISDNLQEAKNSYEENDGVGLDGIYVDLEKVLNSRQMNVFNDTKLKIGSFIQHLVLKNKSDAEEQINQLKTKANLDKEEYDVEISRLRELLANIKCGSTEIMELKNELEAKHSQEMEELRTYFEKKCADLEKHYSEEVFSQHSRKMSGSTCSDADLNSDLIFSHPPGPDGDMKYPLQPNITKKDIINLQNELNSLLNKITNHNLDNMTDEDFTNLKSEIGKSNLNSLLKYDLSVIRNDLQNKYHAELEVLREDNENKVDELNVQYQNKLKSLENHYTEEIENLKIQIDDIQKQRLSICSAVQEVGSSGEFEINEVVQSYERRLQEQVTLAKIDIISALECQIQRLAASESDDEEWPLELLRLRDRFTDRYENDIEVLKKQHQEEIEKLKEEHHKVLNSALERAKRRSLRDSDSLSKGELEILRERDSLKKQVSSLKNLFGEILKYFTQCEDELNNTLVDELLKQGLERNLTQLEEDFNITNDSLAGFDKNSEKDRDSIANIRRVHLTPNFSELINLIDTTCQDEDSKDISLDLRNELCACLEKLKQEANTILALTTNIAKPAVTNGDNQPKNSNLEEKVNSLTRQVISETQAREKLKEEFDEMLKYVESLEKEKNYLENQLDDIIVKEKLVEGDLIQAKNKIAELIENGHKEIISEGYGEGGRSQGLGESMVTLAELREKARSMLAQSRATADPSLLLLIEELCRVGERIKEEAKKEKQDLLQQIEVADKKYKTTQKFLEEQAVEREQERDEAQKKIDLLHGQLRERDKDKMNSERVASEAEQLEHQLQEMTKALQDEIQQRKELESERNEAVEKIKILRDIIRDLEVQAQQKAKEAEEYSEAIHRLECIIEQQDKSISNFKPSDSSRDVSDIQELYKHIEHLETELQQLRVGAELAGSEGAAAEVRKQIFEIENQIDKKTKELEIHSTESTNCSSPSEDISARDLVRAKSLETMDDCEVPLQQLARLKEKLVRHSRAEDAAIKRIKDLEMQVFGLKTELEDSNGEKEYMKKTLQEQLVLISDLQIRLDEQRIRAEHIEKQTNTSLELKLYDLQNEIVSLQEKLLNKDKVLSQQQLSLAETQHRLMKMEEEMSVPKDDELIIAMQKDLEALRIENNELKTKIHKDAQIVPNLVDNIIHDKNSDIEKLREKLDDTEKLLQKYVSLNLDNRELNTLSSLKSSGTSLIEVLSILELSQADQLRRMDNHSQSKSLSLSQGPFNVKVTDETTLEPEISAIEGPSNLHSGIHIRNSTEISHKKVHFVDTDIGHLRNEIANLEEKLKVKDDLIKDYEERMKLLNDLEAKIEKLQLALDETEKALATATLTFEKEQQDSRDKEKDLGIKLAEIKLKLEEKEKQVGMLEQDSVRKDEMCLKLTKEKKELEKGLEAVKEDSYLSLDTLLKQKDTEIRVLSNKLSSQSNQYYKLKQQLQDKDMNAISLQTHVENWKHKFENMEQANATLDQNLQSSKEDIEKLNKDIQNKVAQIDAITTELNGVREKLNKKRKLIKDHEDLIEKQKKTIEKIDDEVKKLKEIVRDRDCEIEIANEDAKRYQNDIAELEYALTQMKKLNIDELKQKVVDKDLKISELEKEKAHLADLINEKERIIAQMAEDSHQLHLNLVTIKSKLKEPGNIVDLGNKLREEQKRTADLLLEIHNLKAQLMKYKNSVSMGSMDNIADQLRKELDYSAQIDSNIMSAVSDQSLSSISESQDIEAYKKALSKEKVSKKQLLSQINTLQANIVELQNVLEKTQVEDAKLIQQLRIQLDTVMDHEELLRKELEEKKASYNQLEKDFETLKRKNISSASRTDSTEYKSLPSKEAVELNELRRNFEVMQEERNQILNDFIVLNEAKLGNESELKVTKDLLNLEMQRSASLEDKVQNLCNIEKRLKDEMIQKRVEIEKLVDQLQQERADFAKQKGALLEEIQEMKHFINQKENIRSTPISDDLLNKIKQLNSALLDNRKLMELLQRVTNDKKMLEGEIAQLRSNNSTTGNVSELIARCDYLFAKVLKLDSVKKALIWQKRYLTEYLQSHQAHCLIQALPNTERFKNQFSTKISPKQRFRSVTYAVMSILRMKFLVKRWHSGVRIAEKVNSRHYKQFLPKPDSKVTNFHVGQPVSCQQFLNAQLGRRTTNPFDVMPRNVEEDDRVSLVSEPEYVPWSGKTPPSKERKQGRARIGSNVLQNEDLTPLRAPELLAQFIERFDRIQQEMGGVVQESAT